LIAVVPLLLLAILVAAQIGLAGYSLWSAGVAARAGARAAAVGGDATEAAKRALPEAMRPDADVAETGGISVAVVMPRLLPGMPRLTLDAKSVLVAGDG